MFKSRFLRSISKVEGGRAEIAALSSSVLAGIPGPYICLQPTNSLHVLPSHQYLYSNHFLCPFHSTVSLSYSILFSPNLHIFLSQLSQKKSFSLTIPFSILLTQYTSTLLYHALFHILLYPSNLSSLNIPLKSSLCSVPDQTC